MYDRAADGWQGIAAPENSAKRVISAKDDFRRRNIVILDSNAGSRDGHSASNDCLLTTGKVTFEDHQFSFVIFFASDNGPMDFIAGTQLSRKSEVLRNNGSTRARQAAFQQCRNQRFSCDRFGNLVLEGALPGFDLETVRFS